MSTLKKIAIGAIACVFLPAIASAEGMLHVGPLEFHPAVKATETYTDNVYSKRDYEKNDYFTKTEAGLDIVLPIREHKLSGGYKAVFQRYARYDGENSTEHFANAALDMKLGSLFGLKLSDEYSKSFETRGEAATGIQEHYEKNEAKVMGTYQLVDVSKATLAYTRTTYDFKKAGYRDRDEDLIEAYVYLKFLPKTSAFLELDRNIIDYNDTNNAQNSNQVSGLFGITWDQSDATTSTVKAGYLKKNFTKKSVADFRTWVVFADVNHEITDSTKVTLGFNRKVNETTLVGSRYILNTSANAKLVHKFFTKFSADAHGSVSSDRYSDVLPGASTIRKDKTTTLGAGLDYKVQDWLTAGLAYENINKKSNDPTAPYRENTYSVSLGFKL